jgi:type I pantothenate kinase
MLDSPAPLTPFHEIPRTRWAELSSSLGNPLTESEIDRLRGLGDALDLAEVESIYIPLTRLLSLYAKAARETHSVTSTFLGLSNSHTPFVIGVAGSVAVGKSTVSRLLRELLSRDPETPNIALVTTDGFLYSNDELERRGIAARKGFPESYDRRALIEFVTQIKSGATEVSAPVYSHLSYDIVPDEHIVVSRPDILIIEGLNVLQSPTLGQELALSDLFDFGIYVDAETDDIKSWYVNRFLQLKSGAFARADSYFHRYANLSDEEATDIALGFWNSVNEPNLVENIAPTRARATLVLRKERDHTVSTVSLRKS